MSNRKKNCTKCNKTKLEKEFRLVLKRGKRSLRSHCLECEKLYRDKYRKANSKLCADLTKKWREKNKEYVKRYSLEYELANRTKRYAKTAKWHKENPEKAREKSRRRRAMKSNVNENFSTDDEIAVMEKFECQCFNCKSKNNLHIDHHYPLFCGNALTIRNAVILCESCNCSKGCKNPEEFYTQDQLTQLYKKYKIDILSKDGK